jgi:tetratricopeptide (TPR) repeat protein
MVSYERWLGEGPELAVLRLMSLFDRPADGESLAALRAEEAIPGLTDSLAALPERGWRRALARLRGARLLSEIDPDQPDTLDTHPLVREHFGERLQGDYADAWREGHNRLFEHLKATAKEYPDTLEEMAPLYAAVAHGCQAGRHQEALDDVCFERIWRWNQAYSWRKLGSFGADLAALSGFFNPPWRRLVAGLSESTEGFILNGAGFCLRALGRLAEAAQPMQASLEAYAAQEVWEYAAIIASNLSELALTVGDVAEALDHARQSVDFADRSGDAFQRMANRTGLADALHQAGRLEEAEAAFGEAEAMQEEWQPGYPVLYSLQGHRYCDLLLGQGKYEEVQGRATQTLEWAKQAGASLLSIALDYLSLGRAHLLHSIQQGTGDYIQAAAHLDQAVDGLRAAGMQDYLPRGLLARAALRRVMGDTEQARTDLDEAAAIAERGGMRLHQADCHLEYARLYLAEGEEGQARQHLAAAKAMIEDMGYHRRDGEVTELEGALRGAWWGERTRSQVRWSRTTD